MLPLISFMIIITCTLIVIPIGILCLCKIGLIPSMHSDMDLNMDINFIENSNHSALVEHADKHVRVSCSDTGQNGRYSEIDSIHKHEIELTTNVEETYLA